jgi:hypothetical protein
MLRIASSKINRIKILQLKLSHTTALVYASLMSFLEVKIEHTVGKWTQIDFTAFLTT